MCAPAAFVALLSVLSAPPGQITLVLTSGVSFDLAAPSKVQKGMVIFTTTDGRYLEIKQTDVARETHAVPEPVFHRIDTTDPRQLGRYAREFRRERGITSLVEQDVPRETTAEKRAAEVKKAAPKKPVKSQKKATGVLSDQSP